MGETMFDNPSFDNHEGVHFFSDEASGLRAIIAIHSTALGPSSGGTRMWDYATSADMVTDALRLSQGMSYKNAMASIPMAAAKPSSGAIRKRISLKRCSGPLDARLKACKANIGRLKMSALIRLISKSRRKKRAMRRA